MYRSVHEATGLEVAIKALPDDASPARRRAFLQEVRAVARIEHPAVIDLLACGEAEAGDWLPAGTPWMAMQLAHRSLAAAPPADWDEAREVLATVLGGLAMVHAHGVLHRDLTPGNVLDCGAPGRPAWKLSDFGLAHLDGQRLRGGTPGFASPEQRAGRREGPASDLYGLGALAHWLVTGRTPAEGPAAARFPVPAGFEAWLGSLLAPEPEDRPGHARVARLGLLALGRAGGAAPARAPSPAGRVSATWIDDDTVEDALPPEVGLGGRPPPPASWVEVWGDDPAVPLSGSLRAALARDPGLVLLAHREPPLWSRFWERDRLWTHVTEVAAGAPARRVRLTGPRGAGHTRLLRWLARTIAAAGALDAVSGADGHGPRAWLLDRGEAPPDLDERVARAAPGLLVVAVGDGPADDEVALGPWTGAECVGFGSLLGAAFLPSTLLAWWSRGWPGELLRWFDRVARVAPGELAAATSLVPPLEDEAVPAPDERRRAATAWCAGVSPREDARAGAGLAAWAASTAEERAACVPPGDRAPLDAAVAGDLAPVIEEPELPLALLAPWLRPEDGAALLRIEAETPDPGSRFERWGAAVRRLHRRGADRLEAGVEAIALDPDRLVARCSLAEQLTARGRSDEALAHVRAVPRDAAGRVAVTEAWVLHQRGDLAGMVACLAGRESFSPAMRGWAANLLGEGARAAGDVERAAARYQEAFQWAGRVDALLNLALLRLGEGRRAEAASAAWIAGTSLPRAHVLVAVHVIRARAVAADDPLEALRRFRRAVASLQPGAALDADTRTQLGLLAAELRAAGAPTAAAEVEAALRGA